MEKESGKMERHESDIQPNKQHARENFLNI